MSKDWLEEGLALVRSVIIVVINNQIPITSYLFNITILATKS